MEIAPIPGELGPLQLLKNLLQHALLGPAA